MMGVHQFFQASPPKNLSNICTRVLWNPSSSPINSLINSPSIQPSMLWVILTTTSLSIKLNFFITMWIVGVERGIYSTVTGSVSNVIPTAINARMKQIVKSVILLTSMYWMNRESVLNVRTINTLIMELALNVLLGSSFRINRARTVENNAPNANLPAHAKHATKQQTTSLKMVPATNVL